MYEIKWKDSALENIDVPYNVNVFISNSEPWLMMNRFSLS